MKGLVLISAFCVLFFFCRVQGESQEDSDGHNSDSNEHTRIVGGMNAVRGQFKSVVLLRNDRDENVGQGCIITMNFVLTVAHVAKNSNPTSIIAGTIDRTSSTTRYMISKIISHPYFNSATFDNDIALLKTSKPIDYNSFIARASLPSSGPTAGTSVNTCGWGAIDEDCTKFPSVLKYFTATTMTNKDCSEKLGIPLDFSFLCTTSQMGQGVCKKDDGDPMLSGNIIYGLVIRSTNIASSGFPILGVRVSKYEQWIRSTAEM